MRVLFSGDLAQSGFGTVTMDLGRELLKLDLDVRFLSQNDLKRLDPPFDSRTVDLRTFSIGRDFLTGELGVRGLAKGLEGLFDGTAPVLMHDGTPYGDWKPDACVMISDFSSAREHWITPLAKLLKELPTFLYLPIEGVGLAPRWAETFRIAYPVAMSNFGADQIERLMGTRPPMVYHGVDTEVFRPVDKNHAVFLVAPGQPAVALTSKNDCKQAWWRLLAETNGQQQIPRKWMLRTDRHMPRKRYNSLMRSVAPALIRHPDWALVLHCSPQDQGGNLWDQVSKLPANLRRQVLLTDSAGIGRDLLVSLYNAADLYVSNSAEGFGLTIAEAIACGVPAVGVQYSSVPEVIGPAGVCVEEGGLIDDPYDAFWWAADEAAFGAAVEDLMTHDTRRVQLGRLGPEHIRSTFRWDAAAQQFRDLIYAAVPEKVAA